MEGHYLEKEFAQRSFFGREQAIDIFLVSALRLRCFLGTLFPPDKKLAEGGRPCEGENQGRE